MPLNVLGNPVSVFLDSNGQPLQGGSIYIGQPNIDPTNPANQITVYQDQGLSIPLQQPIKTTNGQPSLNGQQIPVYLGVGVTTYALAALNAGGVVVMSQPNCAPFSLGGSASGNMTVKEYVAGTDYVVGTSTTLPLPGDPGSGANCFVDFDGVPQHFPDDFTLNSSRTQLVFSSPISAPNKVYLKFGTTQAVGTPAAGSVTDSSVNTGSKLYNRINDWFDVKDFGATGNGTTDDSAAINTGIAYVAGKGGGRLFFPAGTYAIGSTITVNSPGVSLIGAGEGGNHDTGSILAPTVIKWIGVSGGTMISLAPGSTIALCKNDVDGFFLDGNSALAAYGLNVLSCRNSIHRISGRNCSAAILNYGCATGLLEAADCQNNDIWVTGYQETSADGAIFVCGGTATANFSFNHVRNITGNYLNAAVIVNNSDSNVFDMIHLVALAGFTSNGVRLIGNADPNQACRGNKFFLVDPGAGGLYSSGTETGTPANQNEVLAYNTGNGAPVPVLGLGTSLYWSNQGMPVGYQNVSLTTTANQMSVEKKSYGLIRYFGFTSSIAAGGSVTLTYPAAFATAVLKAIASPSGNGNPFQINPTLNNVQIVNNGGSAATFYWEVEGE